jgi:methylated-DNA-[protein]-cysteine S-methyltransferase
MEIINGSCRLGLWHIQVSWSGTTVYRVRFATTGIPGEVPPVIKKFCAGQPVNLNLLNPIAIHDEGVYSRIYTEVRKIPYGETATYGEIAARAETIPRVVGQAMARNITPLVIPCHRVVSAKGIGGFSPSVEIKEYLLAMEQKTLRKISQ